MNPTGNKQPSAEANFFNDAIAARMVLRAGFVPPVVLVPLEATHTTSFRKELADALEASGPVGRCRTCLCFPHQSSAAAQVCCSLPQVLRRVLYKERAPCCAYSRRHCSVSVFECFADLFFCFLICLNIFYAIAPFEFKSEQLVVDVETEGTITTGTMVTQVFATLIKQSVYKIFFQVCDRRGRWQRKLVSLFVLLSFTLHMLCQIVGASFAS